MNKTTSISSPINLNRWMVLIIIAVWIINFIWGELITVNNGFGWDGRLYGAWAKDFYNEVFTVGIPSYYIHRVLPSAFAHYGLRLFQLPITDTYVITAFRVYHLLLLVVSVYVWGLISDEMEFSRIGKWLAFICIFASYPVLKHHFYYPVSTDPTGFALSVLMLYFFLKGKQIGLFLVILFGTFSWPMLSYIGLLLFFFPRKDEEQVSPAPVLSTVLAGGITLIIFVGIIYFYIIKQMTPIIPVKHGAHIIQSAIYPSIILVVLYTFFSLKYMLNASSLYDVPSIIKNIKLKRLILIAVYLILSVIIVSFLATGHSSPLSMKQYFVGDILGRGIVMPLVSFLSHTLYFGPILLITLFMWKAFTKEVNRYGLGLTMVTFAVIIFSLDSESRHLLYFLPFLVVFTVKIIEERGLNNLCYWVLGILSLLYSKVLLIINVAPLEGNILEFPLQGYFMTNGPRMSVTMYVVQGVLVIISAVLLYFLFCYQKQKVIREESL